MRPVNIQNFSLVFILAVFAAKPVLGQRSDFNEESSSLNSNASLELIAPHQEAARKKWANEIAKLESLDKTEKYGDDAILFIGSSSIRRWESIADDVAPYVPIRRGYGGAMTRDLAVFAKRLIVPHQFRAVVMFVANDVRGKEDDQTIDKVKPLTEHVVSIAKAHNHDAPFFIIEVTPTQSRWSVWDKVRQHNAMLREYAFTTPGVHFIATAEHFLDEEKTPRNELFVDDQLHLNEDGYKLWSKLICRRLDEVFQLQTTKQ